MTPSHPVRRVRPLTFPAIVPLAVLVVLVSVYIQFATAFFMSLRFPLRSDLFAQPILNTALLLALGTAYAVWIFAVARRWVSPETGGGFVVAATALSARLVVEMPIFWAHPLPGAVPPEPYATVLPLARGLGLMAIAFGLACVLAACLSERRLRRSGPPWAHTS